MGDCIYLPVEIPNFIEIQKEVSNLDDNFYHSHMGQPIYWHGVPLRNATGITDRSGIGLGQTLVRKKRKMLSCLNTKYLEKMPYTKKFLEKYLPSEVHLVRALKVKAHGYVPRHQDGDVFSLDKGNIARLHLPVITNEQAKYIGHHRYHLEAGKLYYTDVSVFHSVENKGDEDRIHLVIDVDYDENIRLLIANGDPVLPST